MGGLEKQSTKLRTVNIGTLQDAGRSQELEKNMLLTRRKRRIATKCSRLELQHIRRILNQ